MLCKGSIENNMDTIFKLDEWAKRFKLQNE